MSSPPPGSDTAHDATGDPRVTRGAARAVRGAGPRAATFDLGSLLGATALLVTLVSVVAWLAPGVFGDRPASCLAGGSVPCFCETIRDGLLRQPVNALSSLAFCVGAVAAWRRRHAPAPGSPERRLLAAAGWCGLALAGGSLAYHAQLGFAGQVLDLQGMYLVAVLLLVGALWRSGRLTPTGATCAGAGMLVVLTVTQLVAPDTRRWLFVVVLVPGIVAEHRLVRPSAPLHRAVALMALGYAAWLADARQWWCLPESILQGHAVWHLLTAAAAYQLVPLYASGAAPASPGSRQPGVRAG